ncbi:hypothetical protein B0H12DRAFT_1102051 [Mycena haematopus]|nr:hypothetical protein B0H12DRAFT_1145244 [Mycena haematopus]KAJ7264510.1 hypothetical protein B0H12DRAFT_1102051 [Mycena haematopus]
MSRKRPGLRREWVGPRQPHYPESPLRWRGQWQVVGKGREAGNHGEKHKTPASRTVQRRAEG